ncbi:MAG: hypothetical protein KGM17_07290 [Sphingomonadales bacterium]|nr:hypothetical protein [Sphingomonadales bacterium]
MAGAADSSAHWRALRDAGDIQFAPLPPDPPEAPSPWGEALLRALEWLGRLLRPVFEPMGRWLGLGWPAMKIVLLVVAAVLLAALLARAAAAALAARRRRAEATGVAEWRPDEAAALALLADADRLAAEGRFDEAVHVLLARSVAQIEAARPGLLHPASTAREIGAAAWLPVAARAAFGAIATRVEASRFALRALAAEDWAAAREAYAAFALQRLEAGR